MAAPITFAALRWSTLWPLFVYLACALTVFALFSWFLIAHQRDLKQAVFDYLLPASWHGISDHLADFFFKSQTTLVLANLIINGGIVMASLLLFPIKEWCSQRFENGMYGRKQSFHEFPLWRQALEEGKLLLFYVTAQSVILAIGYYPYTWAKILSGTLSTAFLFFSFGIDFISPAFQRRRIAYIYIIQLLSKNALLTFIFGAIFSLPVLWLSQYLLGQSDINLINTASTLLMANIVFFTLAVPTGTYLALKLLPEMDQIKPPSRKLLAWTYIPTTAVLLLFGSFHYTLAASLHHKSQILKCDYDIDWASFQSDLPELGALFSGKAALDIQFDLLVENPTPFDVKLENSIVRFWHHEQPVSETKIQSFKVDAKSTANIPMAFAIKLNADNIQFFGGICEEWRAELELELLPGIPFYISLL